MKKANNIKFIIFGLIAVAFFGASCKKELNQGPIDATYGQVFWTSQANVEEAANAMYGQLRSALRVTGPYDNNEGAFFVCGDFVAGLFNPAANDVFLTYGLTRAQKYNFSYAPYWEGVLYDWSRFYQIIALSNAMLQYVPSMSSNLFPRGDAQKNNYLAEAYFIRAYIYFYLTKVWGDPVYITKTYNDVDFGNIPPVPRSPEKSVLDSCLMDLRAAQTYMQYSGGDPTLTTRANKGSVQALMANIFAWQHSDDSTHYYCQQVINNGGYSLEPASSYTNIWKGMSSSESIFELAMLYNASDPNFKTSNAWSEASFDFFGAFLVIPTQNLRTTSWTIPYTQVLDSNYLNMDTAHDARFKAIMVRSNTSSSAAYNMVKYSNLQYGDKATNSYPYINNDLVLMRLPEMYLLDAEALARKGNVSGARDALQVVEDRAGINSYTIPQNKTAMMGEIIREDGREFIGEGHFFFDLIRTKNDGLANVGLDFLGNLGYGTTNVGDRLNDAMKGYYWPLNMGTLLNQDPLLTQNPWWTIHSGH